MHATHARAARATASIDDRLAGAPISWGACEVPGWGVMPDPESVLSEMAELGIRGTELGPPGFLPDEPGALADMLRRHGLTLVGGFVPLVLTFAAEHFGTGLAVPMMIGTWIGASAWAAAVFFGPETRGRVLVPDLVVA